MCGKGTYLEWTFIYIFKLKGRGQTRSEGRGGGGYLKMVWIRAFMLYVTLTFCTFRMILICKLATFCAFFNL